MKILDMTVINNSEVIELQGEFKTTIGKILESLFGFIAVENINEIRLFGSCVENKTKIEKGERYFFGIFQYPDRTIKVLPNDIDILVITKTGKRPIKANLKCNGYVLGYEESWGYGYSYWKNGYSYDKVHVLVVSQKEWNKNLKANDPTTISITNNCRILFKKEQ